MSKFVGYYNLCPIHDPKQFIGIAADRDEDNIITTLDKNIIIIFKISNHTQINSWSVKDKLSAKVVYDRRSGKYVGVFANHVLRCWDETTMDINKCKRLKFDKTIADLIPSGEDTYVLYDDGTCELLAIALETRKTVQGFNALQKLRPNVCIKDTKLYTLRSGERLLTYFECDNENEEVSLIKSVLKDGICQNTVRFNLTKRYPDIRVTGYTVIDGESGNPMLLTLWSDARLFIMKLDESAKEEDSPGRFVSIISTLKNNSPVSLVGVSEQSVVMYGANSNQEGASLILYNTKFKITKSTQFLKVYMDFSRLWCFGEYIILAMGQNLSVVTYHMVQERMADLLGCEASDCPDKLVECDHINEEEQLQEAIEYISATAQSEISDTISPSALKNHTNSAHNIMITQSNENDAPFASVLEFDHELNNLERLQMQVHITESEHAEIDGANMILMSNSIDNGFNTREIRYLSQQLELSGASEHEITEKLLTVLIKANILPEIKACLCRYSNISEKMIAKTLNFILLEMRGSGEVEEEQTYLHRDILNLLLSFTYNDGPMAINARKELQYEVVLYLLEYLYNLLAKEESSHNLLLCNELEFEMKILHWFGVIIDSQFQKLVLSRDLNLLNIIMNWSNLLENLRSDFENLQELSALLRNLLKNRITEQEKDCSKWYSIEEVYLY